MSTTWYVARTGEWQKNIEPVEIDFYTEKNVVIKGNRRSRLSQYDSYFPTFDEAKKHLIEKATSAIEDAQSKVAYQQRLLERYMSLAPIEAG